MSPSRSVKLRSNKLSNQNEIEWLYKKLKGLRSSASVPLMLDVSKITFVMPEAMLALINVARLWHRWTEEVVTFENLHPDVYSYLERMDVFDVCADFLNPGTCSGNPKLYYRSSASNTLLEVMKISSEEDQNSEDVNDAMRRAQHILTTWFDESRAGPICTILAEIASNIIHSKDCGFATIQRYQEPGFDDASRVHVAITDLGIGIQESLCTKHVELKDKWAVGSEYILHAFKAGVTSRLTAGGNGLLLVKKIVQDGQGTLVVRSRCSLVRFNDTRVAHLDDLIEIPGVQVWISIKGKAEGK